MSDSEEEHDDLFSFDGDAIEPYSNEPEYSEAELAKWQTISY